MIRIVIADDHPEIRSAWSMFLRSHANINVVGECTNGQEAIDTVRESQPDIVLMDINMKPISGIEATSKLAAEYPGVKVIGVSFHTSPVYIRKMLDAGARGYVFKYAVAEDLVKAIEEVYKGNIFLGKGVKDGTK
ncbi:response regulator transcription factor [Agriterribacter sp.]|uniref:response regulator n=1 Tax=Agriterribacter sp. TaxID=2821509 RepID=UPI002CC89CFE|nr:response regulator transcription factor [Agriterribacter sp.]HTN07682.1 response regulator transcription factor [Agriterribacter sp.]